jgi:hypothetical protein
MSETDPIETNVETNIEAAVFRRLLAHLDSRKDVQNIDLMNLAGFCRNCLSKWYVAAAADAGRANGLRAGEGTRVRHALRRVEGEIPDAGYGRAGECIRGAQAGLNKLSSRRTVRLERAVRQVAVVAHLANPLQQRLVQARAALAQYFRQRNDGRRGASLPARQVLGDGEETYQVKQVGIRQWFGRGAPMLVLNFHQACEALFVLLIEQLLKTCQRVFTFLDVTGIADETVQE